MIRTQVAIVGAGPAGLMLAHLLHRAGVGCIVLESQARGYIEGRVRAGVLEQGTVDLMKASGVGERLGREGLVHHGIELRFDGRAHRIDLAHLTGGRSITVYGQHEVIKDLVQARLAAGGELRFECSDVAVHDLDTRHPRVTFTHDSQRREIACDAVAGCDGSHGICRPAIPRSGLAIHERAYPFAWLGILARAAPSRQELVYAHHERGFALFSMRSPQLTRLYLQVAPDEQPTAWPDERIWDELDARFEGGDGWRPARGPIVEKSVTGMRSLVVEPMRHGRLFLAGDAAHIVPPTGAKGLNLAMADVRVLAPALASFCATGDEQALDAYSATCLKRVWRAEHFSWWMTALLHRFPEGDSFQRRLQHAQLEYVVSSPAAGASLAENYVGLPFDSATA
ncbi:MAG TPA: 4-hydroxybenzoate 3-monooxygenase [Usitatibacter sp.]|jgi:p-hydroxybenzoate 3-monooxygenase|nr:4-hydroxybenzoate 3-monooxygenase [Usitatibacter sp.]